MSHALVFSSLFLAACNLSPASSDEKETGDPGVGGLTVSDVRQGEVAEGELVRLEGVVVTSGLSSDGEGFFVQDAGGGAWSGIYIFLQGVQDAVDVAPGDVVTVEGEYVEYYDFSEITVTAAFDVSKTGTGEVTVDSVSCGESDWEPWEGCLVSIQGVEMTSGVDSYGQVQTSCGVQIDNMFHDFSGSSGMTCTSVTGPISYGWEAYSIQPRSDADMVGCGGGEEPESTTIKDLKEGGWTEGQWAILEGVVATSGLAKDTTGFFIQDEGGGESAGLYVYVGGNSVEVSAGMVMDVEGEITEYYGMLEIKPSSSSDMVDTGDTATPVAASLTSIPDEWEVWEGGLITVQNVEILGDEGYGEMSTSWGDLLVDDFFFEHGLLVGDTLSSITGGLFYSWDNWKLCPRDESDLVW